MSEAQRIIEVAVLIAAELGDDFDAIPYNKATWIKTRGGEPFRDVNLPFQRDYLAAASAVVKLLANPARASMSHGEKL
jgi:hypothetical protein